MKTILIVDDTKANINLLINLLDEKYDIIAARDGITALEIVKEEGQDIDLILLDIMMPEMDGYEVCQKLKADKKTDAIPIIFITAKTDEESIEKAFDVGGVDYVSKPFKPKEVLSRVSTHLELSNQQQMLENMLLQQSKLAAIGEMIDAVAHQWIQPISLINMQVQMVGYTFEDKKLDQKYVDKFQEETMFQLEHLTDTLKEFRNFFRPDKEVEEFDVRDMLKKVLLLVKDEFIKNKIVVTVDDKDNFTLLGIENEFKHLVLNIINNARDAFNENSKKDRKIQINILNNDVSKSIEIIDNAGGIPKSVIDDIFKAHITTKADSNGTGIGLYLSSQIARKHDGTLEAVNTKNGAKFIFTQIK